jgi:hypothetical protein
VETGGGEDGPSDASEDQRDDVAAVGLGLGYEVEKESNTSQANDGGGGGADYLRTVETGVLPRWSEEGNEMTAMR